MSEEAPSDPAVEEAARLYEEGTLRYQTADYPGAVELFTEAFRQASSIDDEEQRERAMTLLLFNLAQAHVKAYEVDDDITHLRTARELLSRHIQNEQDAEDRADAERLLGQVDERLSELDAPKRATEPAVPPDSQAQQAGKDEPGRANGFTISGSVVTALALPALAVMTAGLVMGSRAEQEFIDGPTAEDRNAADAKGRTGNVLAIAGGVGSAALAGIGTALVVVGIRKRRESARARLTPGPGFVGTGFSWRF